MKVSEAIEKLTVKRDDALRFQKLYRGGDVGWSANESKAIAFNIAINTLEQIDEPQAEKVEVPPMIDKFIKDHTDHIFEICAWSDHYGNDGRTCDDPELSVVLDWYGNNTTEFYEAVVNGYTVKPKQWVVRTSSAYFEQFSGDSNHPFDFDATHNIRVALTFNDRAKAVAVAMLVEGSVEEV